MQDIYRTPRSRIDPLGGHAWRHFCPFSISNLYKINMETLSHFQFGYKAYDLLILRLLLLLL